VETSVSVVSSPGAFAAGPIGGTAVELAPVHGGGFAGGFDCVVGLGSNLGARAVWLDRGAQLLASRGQLVGLSRLYETAPVGDVQQGPFLNAALRFRFHGSLLRLLDTLLEIERVCGRERRERWGPRTLDLDLLWVSGVATAGPRLTVPHVELERRAFALLPLLDVAPTAKHPSTRRSYADLVPALDCSGVLSRAQWLLAPGEEPSGLPVARDLVGTTPCQEKAQIARRDPQPNFTAAPAAGYQRVRASSASRCDTLGLQFPHDD
jgi:2-amino-4-hydroxy-6-hydroxymethyldihydropteridine diphosphokinase